ncbi:MAG: hypothetical protein K6G90_14580 [Clostridia bacterium]|nr:hypothetical protein [Clostridia bacterium]
MIKEKIIDLTDYFKGYFAQFGFVPANRNGDPYYRKGKQYYKAVSGNKLKEIDTVNSNFITKHYQVSGASLNQYTRNGKFKNCFQDESGRWHYDSGEVSDKLTERDPIPERGRYFVIPGRYPYFYNPDEDIVINAVRGSIIPPQIVAHGYLQYNMSVDGEDKSLLGHQIVAMVMLANPRGCDSVHHCNGIRKDNRPENLLWCFWQTEHRQLDKMSKAVRDYPQNDKLREQYQAEIERIRQLNEDALTKQTEATV